MTELEKCMIGVSHVGIRTIRRENSRFKAAIQNYRSKRFIRYTIYL